MKGIVLLLILAFIGAVVYFGFFAGRAGSHGLTEEQKQWALATCGVLTESNRGQHNLLGACQKTGTNAAKQKRLLEQW